MPKPCSDPMYSNNDKTDIWTLIIIFSPVIFILIVFPIIFLSIPAEIPIDEECYRYKSDTLIIVGYNRVAEACANEIAKMYNYGYTNVVVDAATEYDTGRILMFKVQS